MMHIALPTYEFHPVNPGGAGVFTAGACRMLARAGYRVTVLCVFPAAEVEAAQRLVVADDLRPGSVRCVSAPDLLRDWNAPHGSHFQEKSAWFAEALRRLHAQDPIDLVEFPEYAGMALQTLEARTAGHFPDIPIVCRLHGSLELIDQVEGITPSAQQREMYAAERRSMSLADALLTPSDGLGRFYQRFYALDARTMWRSPPPMERLLQGLKRPARLPDPAHFLQFGKLQEVKGVDTFARAAVHLAGMTPAQRWRFTFVGRDMPCARHGRMTSACIRQIVPELLEEDCFEFVPFVDRLALPELTRTVRAAVVPSRFETFCLAAHELRAVGVPLIVPRLDGFSDYLNETTGCLTYDGTSHGLAAAIQRLRDDAELAEQLEAAPGPTYGPFAAPYDALWEQLRARRVREREAG